MRDDLQSVDISWFLIFFLKLVAVIHFRLYVFSLLCRNIDKAGSLDNYIMHTADKDLQSDVAMDLKIEMLEKMLRQQGMAAQAMQGLGLPPAAQAVLESETQPPSS